MSTTTVELALTVEQIAEAFSRLHSDEQAAFFAHVARACKNQGFLAETQWHFMCSHLHGEDGVSKIDQDLQREGRESLMSMAAPLYLHTCRAIDADMEALWRTA